MSRKHSAVAALVFVVVPATRALATPDTGIAADRFFPALGPSALLSLEGADTPPAERVVAVLSIDWAHQPLSIVNRNTGDVVTRPVRDQVFLDGAIEVGLNRRLALGLGVPFVVAARGDRLSGLGAGDERPLGARELGDVRLRAKLRVAERLLRVALLGELTLPGGGEHDFAATLGPTVALRIALDLPLRHAQLFATVGTRYAGERSLFGTAFGSELEYGAGALLGIPRARFPLDHLGLVTELTGAWGTIHPLELRAALRVALPVGISLDAGCGVGLLDQPTEPAVRPIVALRFAQ